MILKNNLISMSLLLGIIVNAVTAYPEYEDETSSIQDESERNNANEKLYEMEETERKLEPFNNMDMQMGAKTEVSIKNVRNISHNQLSNEYVSIEHDDHNHNFEQGEEFEDDDNNTSTQVTQRNIIALLNDEEYSTEMPLNKHNTKMGKQFTTTTTTIPQYIRRIDEIKQILKNNDFNISSSDYEDEIIDHMLRKQTTKMPLNKNLDYFSNERDEIVPLAMKYYDDVPSENASASRHKEKDSSEDYYEDEYNEPQLTTITTTAQTPDNSILLTSSTGFSTISTTFKTTKITPSPITVPLTTTTIPLAGQVNLSLFTTLSPLIPPPQPPQVQTQTGLGITTASHIASAAAAAAAAAATGGGAVAASSDKKAKQIPIVSTVPVVTTTTTTTTRRRLLPHEQLRNYIEDAYIRMPLAVIVDPSEQSLENTKTLWNDALRTNLNIKIILVTLNKSEESPAAFNFNNTKQFLAGLNSIKEQNSGDAFRGILDAAELVPYDSAVFISTAQLAKHTDRVQDSAITLLKKRIRLYLIWFGERSLSENETQDSIGGILGEVAIRSGGEILHVVSTENSQELEGSSTLTIIADALRGSHEVDVPVDTTLSSLHVKIDKLMRRAVLETPNGDINLKKLVKFKTDTLTTFNDDDNRLDAYVPLTKLRKASVYTLKLIPEDLTAEYSVFIRGERKADAFLDDMIKRFEKLFFERHSSHTAPERKRQSLVKYEDDANVDTHSKLQFPSNEEKSVPKNEVETFSTKEIYHKTMEIEKNNKSSLAVATAQSQQRNSNFLYKTNTKIEMGTQSQVLIAPGILSQLYFEVTNTGYDSNYYNIQVVDEWRYLIALSPQSLFLRAGQMATATVSVFAPQDTQPNTIDHITFTTTTSTNTASLTVNLKVITTTDAQDNISPSIDWTFGSRCEGISTEFDFCSERFWSMYITAQDFQTGIMRLQATPSSGLIYTKSYSVGTTEPLKATYVASCCDARVTLTAFDGAGNQRSYSIDVRDLYLTDAAIAAVVLGILLLILLIILIIFSIVWYCRRRKIILDLPTYRSHSTRSTE